MGRLRKVVAWLLCLVMLSSAVACTGEKSASGQKVSGVKTPQQNSTPSPGKHREKAVAVRDGAPGNIVVDNNSLAHVLGAAEANRKGTIEKYEKAQKAICEQNQAACTQMVKDVAGTGLDFVPIVGDIKGFAEANTALDYLAAAVGLIPGAGDVAGKTLKAAETALKKGDVAEASRLINKASSEISAKTPTGSKGNPLNVIDGQNKPSMIENRDYSGHSLDRMQRQGITPTTVENAIRPENAIQGKRPGTTAYYDSKNNITVITDTKTGTVVTVDFGRIKQ